VRIGIIGAGLSGLATAFYLRRLSPQAELVVYEADARAGGTMRTEVVGGMRFEAGANGFLTNKPDCLQLVRDCGLGERLLPSSNAMRTRYVYHDRLHRLPASPREFVASELLTWPQKLRVLCEPLVSAAPTDRDETVREFGDRRLGAGVSSVFLDALCIGIYGAAPERLSMRAAFPLIAALESEHGSLLKGMLARRRTAGPRAVLTSLHGGLGELSARLAETAGVEWRWSTPVRNIDRASEGFVVSDDSGPTAFDRVIVCTPAYAAAVLLRDLDRDLSELLAQIEYTPIAVAGLGYRSVESAATGAARHDGFGVLTTSASRAPILGVVWESSVFPGRAPPGHRCVRVMIGGQRNPELVEQDDSGLVATARAGLRQVLGEDPDPETVFVQRWPRGIPCYGHGHLARIGAIDSRLAQWPRLHLNGNAYRGVAMNDCVRNSRELAGRLATETLGEPT
jgi:oxygen-dependent protoporphyrinogen oxidase